jgi:hypothetical protein
MIAARASAGSVMPARAVVRRAVIIAPCSSGSLSRTSPTADPRRSTSLAPGASSLPSPEVREPSLCVPAFGLAPPAQHLDQSDLRHTRTYIPGWTSPPEPQRGEHPPVVHTLSVGWSSWGCCSFRVFVSSQVGPKGQRWADRHDGLGQRLLGMARTKEDAQDPAGPRVQPHVITERSRHPE